MCGAKVVEKTTYLNDKLSSFLALHIRDEPWEAYRKKKGVKLVEIIIKFIAYRRALLAAWAFARLWFHVDTTWGHCCGTANKNENNVMSWNLGALRDDLAEHFRCVQEMLQPLEQLYRHKEIYDLANTYTLENHLLLFSLLNEIDGALCWYLLATTQLDIFVQEFCGIWAHFIASASSRHFLR